MDLMDKRIDVVDNEKYVEAATCTSTGNVDFISDTVRCTDDLNKYNGCREEVDQMDDIPKIGKEFKSEEEAEVFYNDYARVTGFSIQRSKVHRKFGVIVDRIFCCSREGKREKDKRREENVKKPRAETRIGCKAEMRIRMKCDGKFEVTNFEALHNHELVQPKMVHLLRSHRKLTIAQAAQVDMADSSGIAPSKYMLNDV